jgi:lipopolysaccharide/colanic/teichoic acid biosynthesis glycosyltransferase
VFRFFDVLISIFGLLLLWPLMLLLYLVGFADTGSPIFRQERVGQHQAPFILIKFRTMHIKTDSIASHLVDARAVTSWGMFLRRSKFDELPQLLNVLKGEMSLVGPRPSLFNQVELIKERNYRGVFNVRPGITGLAQVYGIDMSDAKLLAKIDASMIRDLTLASYFKYILLTIVGHGSGDRVKLR